LSGGGIFKVTLSVSWRQNNGRVFGENTNINGQIDGAEDMSGDGMLNSPVQLAEYIFQRGT
jgi:hypothetical protein